MIMVEFSQPFRPVSEISSPVVLSTITAPYVSDSGTNKYEPVVNEQTKRSMERKMWNSYIKNKFSLSFKDFILGNQKSASNSKKKKRPNYFEIINDSFDLMQDKLTDVILENETPDILVNIPRESAATFEFYRSLELIEYGRMAMRNALEEFGSKAKD